MNRELFFSLICNAALLLSLGLIFDIFYYRRGTTNRLGRIVIGLVIGLVAIVLMATPARWVSGVFFDTRTILIGVTGLFFGPLPTLTAMAVAVVYRTGLGGGGAAMGVATICAAGLLGLAWRHYRCRDARELSLAELFLFGLVVHGVMILCIFLLPPEVQGKTFHALVLPVLLIYPAGTALLGNLLTSRQRRHRVETELVASEELHRSILQTTMDGIWRLDLQGGLIEVNETYCRMSGYAKQELLAMNIADLEVIHSPEDIAAHIRKTREQETIRFESQHRRKDGSIFDVEVSAQFLALEGGYCVAFLRDITERKQAAQDLQASRQQYRDLVEGTPDLITRVDTTGRLVFVNHAAETFFGLAPQDCLGRPAFDFIHPADRAATVAAFEAWLNSGKTVFSHENRQVGIDGQEHHLAWSIRAEHGENGEVRGFAGTARDVTEKKRAAEEKSKLENQLQQAQRMESLGVLAGGIAHDFNNILMAILGNADLALLRLPPESPAVGNLQQIESAARKAADLAGQMLAYSGKGRFVVEPLDLNRLIEEMIHILKVSISKKVVLKFNYGLKIPAVEGDATQLRQIVMNLVINASEAIGDRSGVIAVTTGLRECDRSYLHGPTRDDDLPAGSYACVEVADTGCGMEEETLQRLFEPFFTTKFTGRGLGMAATLGIVRGHKGTIKVHSEVGKGTTFTVLLPASTRATLPAAPAGTEPPRQGGGTVLLVDDEEAIRAVGKDMLQALGFTVLLANDGHEAVDLYRERHGEIGWVLMDLTMPRLDGEQAFRELRRFDPAARVIMTSGYNVQELSQKFLGEGMAGFLQKPFRVSALSEVLNSLGENPGT
jgi:two-component system, cell cycle sensor histidine kinase and response regulator CckA